MMHPAHRTILSTALALLATVLAAGCGGRTPDGQGLVYSAACPDGSDLQVRFREVDGSLQAQACCGPASARREEGWPDFPLPTADRMRKGEPAEPGRLPIEDRMRAEDRLPDPGPLDTAERMRADPRPRRDPWPVADR